MHDDEQLVEAYRNGDETAFEQLFEHYRHRIFLYCLRILQNRSSAEEVFQEVFLRVHTKLGDYKGQQRFAHWLFTIAHRLCLDELRKRKRSGWLLFSDQPVDTQDKTDLERDLSKNQLQTAILRKVDELEARTRQVFLLRVEGELMFREIAELMDEPLNTVLGRYHQAIIALKASFKEESL